MSHGLRLLRGTASGIVATLAALIFHASSGGTPSMVATGISLLLAVWMGTLLAGRTWGLCALLGINGFAQIAMHWVMDALRYAHTAPTSHGNSLVLAQSHAHHLGGKNFATTQAIAEHTSASTPTVFMVIAHCVAAVLSAFMCHWAEKILLALCNATWGRRVFALFCLPVFVSRPRTIVIWPQLYVPTTNWGGSTGSRAPPLPA